jgi:hypothetical protein
MVVVAELDTIIAAANVQPPKQLLCFSILSVLRAASSEANAHEMHVRYDEVEVGVAAKFSKTV